MYTIIMLFVLLFRNSLNAHEMWSEQEMETIARQVSIHEGTHRPGKLIVWNQGEDGLSLGIAHFTWYPTSSARKIRGKFAELVEFNAQHGIEFPLKGKKEYSDLFAPWQTKEEFLKASAEQIDALTKYLEQTRHLQVRFIIKRAQEALEMVKSYAKPEDHKNITAQYERFMATPHGRFILVDYLNLTGEAGMYKVISRLKGTDKHTLAAEFVEHAIEVLTKQAESSRNRAQMRWLQGWKNRLSNYSTISFSKA